MFKLSAAIVIAENRLHAGCDAYGNTEGLHFRCEYGKIGEKKHKEGMNMDLYRDPATMDPEELRAYLGDVRCELETLNEDEPEDETSEEFVDWAEEHEALEDLADEIIDRLESLGEPLE